MLLNAFKYKIFYLIFINKQHGNSHHFVGKILSWQPKQPIKSWWCQILAFLLLEWLLPMIVTNMAMHMCMEFYNFLCASTNTRSTRLYMHTSKCKRVCTYSQCHQMKGLDIITSQIPLISSCSEVPKTLKRMHAHSGLTLGKQAHLPKWLEPPCLCKLLLPIVWLYLIYFIFSTRASIYT